MESAQLRRAILFTLLFGFGVFAVIEKSVMAVSPPLGEMKFKVHCAVCHANGENCIRGDKTLFRKDREKHGIKSAKEIVDTMRKPGPGMPAFDKKHVSNKDAVAIAEYIQKTYKICKKTM
jgi:cytochrome c6